MLWGTKVGNKIKERVHVKFIHYFSQTNSSQEKKTTAISSWTTITQDPSRTTTPHSPCPCTSYQNKAQATPSYPSPLLWSGSKPGSEQKRSWFGGD